MVTLAAFALLILAPYWLGPFLLKSRQRRPLVPESMHVAPDSGSLPPLLVPFVTQTQRTFAALGFRNAAMLQSKLGVALLADSESGAIATGLALPTPDGKVHSLVGFSTRLSTGNRLMTSNSPLPSPTPDRSTDSSMRLPRERDVVRLFEIHSERVIRAMVAGATPERLTLDDPLAYQLSEEMASLAHAEASGYWQRQGNELALTWKGAVLSAWRLLPPWRDLRVSHDERQVRALGIARV